MNLLTMTSVNWSLWTEGLWTMHRNWRFLTLKFCVCVVGYTNSAHIWCSQQKFISKCWKRGSSRYHNTAMVMNNNNAVSGRQWQCRQQNVTRINWYKCICDKSQYVHRIVLMLCHTLEHNVYDNSAVADCSTIIMAACIIMFFCYCVLSSSASATAKLRKKNEQTN